MNLRRLFAWLLPAPQPRTQRPSSPSERSAAGAGAFVFVKLPGAIQPVDRGAFEDPLHDALVAGGLGEVSGGGTGLVDLPGGGKAIEFAGIDVDVADAARLSEALALLRTELVKLSAPLGSELHYTLEARDLLDRLGRDGWLLAQPRA